MSVCIVALQRKKFQKSEITMEVGGWVQVSLGILFAGKSSPNSPKLVFWSSIPCVFCLYKLYTLLKAVGYYDLSVLSMSVMGFKKKSVDGGGLAG